MKLTSRVYISWFSRLHQRRPVNSPIPRCWYSYTVGLCTLSSALLGTEHSFANFTRVRVKAFTVKSSVSYYTGKYDLHDTGVNIFLSCVSLTVISVVKKTDTGKCFYCQWLQIKWTQKHCTVPGLWCLFGLLKIQQRLRQDFGKQLLTCLL